MKCLGPMALVLSAVTLSACGLSAPATNDLAAEATVSARAKGKETFRVVRSIKTAQWDRIECLESTLASFPGEKMRPNGRHRNEDIVKAFGADMPPSRAVLLHYYKGWDAQGDSKPPVLLVHGTGTDGTASWIAPLGKKGLAPVLAERGRRVFAVTFAHRHGDNTLQAENLNAAIARITGMTGATQVDVVGHSKGTVAIRALASNVKYEWMTPFMKDIRRMVLVAGPLLGLDTTFRHSIFAYGLFPEKDKSYLNAPLPWTGGVFFGVWQDTSEVSIYSRFGNYFPGQAQLLHKWDDQYPLPQLEADWYTTYYGGQGLVSMSEGIDKAIADGGHYIAKLRKHPVDPSVTFAVLAGDHADLEGVHNEHTGPSDGIAFVASATHTDDMVKGGARLQKKEVLPLNHLELITDPRAHDWVARQL